MLKVGCDFQLENWRPFFIINFIIIIIIKMLKLISIRPFLSHNSFDKSISNGILRISQPLSSDPHGRVTIYDSFRFCIKHKPSMAGGLLWCLSGTMFYVPGVDYKISMLGFLSLSSYNIINALTQRVTISRI